MIKQHLVNLGLGRGGLLPVQRLDRSSGTCGVARRPSRRRPLPRSEPSGSSRSSASSISTRSSSSAIATSSSRLKSRSRGRAGWPSRGRAASRRCRAEVGAASGLLEVAPGAYRDAVRVDGHDRDLVAFRHPAQHNRDQHAPSVRGPDRRTSRRSWSRTSRARAIGPNAFRHDAEQAKRGGMMRFCIAAEREVGQAVSPRPRAACGLRPLAQRGPWRGSAA